jgi:Ca2+-binding EF-hand superfamily protein
MNAQSWRMMGGAGLLAALVVLSGLALAPAAAPVQRTHGSQDFVFLAESRPILVRMRARLDDRSVEAVWGDFMKYLFAYLDVNGDGVLSKEEAERVPTISQIRNAGLSLGGGRGGMMGGKMAEPKMENLDTDKDGKVSLAELSDFYRRNGFGPFQYQLETTFRPQGLELFSGKGIEPPVETVSAAIFNLLDTNGDGKLSKEELTAAPDVLLRMDEDQDEMITPRELVPNFQPRGGMMAMMMRGRGKDKDKKVTTVVPIPTSGEAPADLAKAMQQRYAPRAKGEVKFNRKQLGLDEATFRRLDTDGDGVLDSKELAGFVKLPPDLELILHLGDEPTAARIEVVASEGGLSPLAAKLKARGALALLDLGATRLDFRGKGSEDDGSSQFAGLIRQQVLAQFSTADKDNKGYLTIKDGGGDRFFRDVFKAMDRDGDGKLYQKEVIAYLDEYQKIQAKANASCVALVLADQSRGLFDLLDVNRDSRLSVREMRGAVGLLKELDHEGKGYLSRADLPRSYQLTLRRGPSDANGISETAQIAAVYGAGYDASKGRQGGVGPRWFQKMDKNRDGDVSRKEWLFSDELFRQIDTDGDGLISLAEAERYEALRRKQK